jgi:hypothetical protein
MISLHDLVLSDLVSAGHEIFFYFKSHYFEAKVSSLGCIYETRANGNHIFQDRLAFESLAEWSDACIQNVAKEYVTRFSSWKRISHKESGLSLHTLRQLYSNFSYGKLPCTNQTLVTFKACLSSCLEHIDNLENIIKEQRDYIHGNTSFVPEQRILKPQCLKKIEFLHNNYLKVNAMSS